MSALESVIMYQLTIGEAYHGRRLSRITNRDESDGHLEERVVLLVRAAMQATA